MKKLVVNIAVCALFGTSFTAHAALNASADGTLIYDSDLNVTWLSDANYSESSHYHNTGSMNWGAAVTWASGLDFHGNTDWRLPTPDEMDHLFYGLGGTYLVHISDSHNQDYNLFSNIQDSYWSNTEDPKNPANALAYGFNYGINSTGHSSSYDKHVGHYAMAVTAGNITGVVPEPETYAMLLAGLGLLGWRMRSVRS